MWLTTAASLEYSLRRPADDWNAARCGAARRPAWRKAWGAQIWGAQIWGETDGADRGWPPAQQAHILDLPTPGRNHQRITNREPHGVPVAIDIAA